ncbi:hypothetical protein BR93DRAFT_922892 [Coniochaeta sp. PMI_546]|nr:hypothetical protein BR93DRAFT_922892 [Coniochaeta sp. PMI_546]
MSKGAQIRSVIGTMHHRLTNNNWSCKRVVLTHFKYVHTAYRAYGGHTLKHEGKPNGTTGNRFQPSQIPNPRRLLQPHTFENDTTISNRTLTAFGTGAKHVTRSRKFCLFSHGAARLVPV